MTLRARLRTLNNSISPRMGLLIGMIVGAIVYLLLAGCQSAPVRQELVIYKGCDGRDHASIVQVHVGLPPLQCPLRAYALGLHADAALYAVAGAFGCAFWSPVDQFRVRTAEVYVFPGEPFLAHEMRHARGESHPVLGQFAEECGS